MKVVDPKTPFDYILKSERKLPDDEQSVFLLKRLSAREEANIQDRLTSRVQKGKDVETTINSGTYILQTLKAGLVGWSKVYNDEGIVLFDADSKKKEAMIDYLPSEVRDELFSAIRQQVEVTEEEEGN